MLLGILITIGLAASVVVTAGWVHLIIEEYKEGRGDE